MPKISDFNFKNKKSKINKYFPWDFSPNPIEWVKNNKNRFNINNKIDSIKKDEAKKIDSKIEKMEKNKDVENIDIKEKIIFFDKKNRFKNKKEIKVNVFKKNRKYIQKSIKIDSKLKLNLFFLKKFFYIKGSQKDILLYLVKDKKLIHNVNISTLSISLNISKNTIKTGIKRLENKNIIINESFKRGRNGYIIIKIPRIINDVIIKLFEKELKEIDSKLIKNTTCSSSSMYNNYYSTSLPKIWDSINIEPLKEIGLNKSHIIQIQRELMKKPEIMIDTKIIQDSINALAFDIKYNDISKDFNKPPTVVLISLLKKGIPYTSKNPKKFYEEKIKIDNDNKNK